jgi:hypothetical protein
MRKSLQSSRRVQEAVDAWFHRREQGQWSGPTSFRDQFSPATSKASSDNVIVSRGRSRRAMSAGSSEANDHAARVQAAVTASNRHHPNSEEQRTETGVPNLRSEAQSRIPLQARPTIRRNFQDRLRDEIPRDAGPGSVTASKVNAVEVGRRAELQSTQNRRVENSQQGSDDRLSGKNSSSFRVTRTATADEIAQAGDQFKRASPFRGMLEASIRNGASRPSGPSAGFNSVHNLSVTGKRLEFGIPGRASVRMTDSHIADENRAPVSVDSSNRGTANEGMFSSQQSSSGMASHWDLDVSKRREAHLRSQPRGMLPRIR